MNRNHITVVINDPNRFFAEGLKDCITDSFSACGLRVDFSDCIFNSRARLAFLAAETLSVANTHYLNNRFATRSLGIFIIRDRQPEPAEATVSRSRNLTHFSALYRTQPVEEALAGIHEQLGQQSDLRNILVTPCAARSSNNLTRRETEILRYLARGISNSTVARFLHISEKTVSAHKRNIMSKLNMIRPAELNYWLLQEGWCDSWRAREK